MNRPRAADDFATIRARMEELRQEREGTEPSEKGAQRDAPMPSGGAIRSPDYSTVRHWFNAAPSETGAGPGRVRQSGTGRS